MLSSVVPLFVSDGDLDAAWQQYDAAMLAMQSLYADPASSEAERRVAVEAAFSAETNFRAMFARAEQRRPGK